MTTGKKRLAKTGTRLSGNLTVLGILDGGSVEPVYIVWNHSCWCPMACKVMTSPERAEAEACTLASFAHPSIVRVFGVESPSNLLMPYLEGQLLSGVLDGAPGGRMPVSDALRVTIHLGSALAHIHDRGFLHMDVKLDNVMIDPNGRPILFDFGSARRIGSSRPGEVIGTDAYISPEECAQRAVGPAADIFSLAVVLYELLSGELPFGEGSAAAPFPQMKGNPKSLRGLRTGIPAKLENLLFACLERNPNFRPTLAEILPQLNGFISRGPRMWPDDLELGRRTAAPSRDRKRSAQQSRPHGFCNATGCPSP